MGDCDLQSMAGRRTSSRVNPKDWLYMFRTFHWKGAGHGLDFVVVPVQILPDEAGRSNLSGNQVCFSFISPDPVESKDSQHETFSHFAKSVELDSVAVCTEEQKKMQEKLNGVIERFHAEGHHERANEVRVTLDEVNECWDHMQLILSFGRKGAAARVLAAASSAPPLSTSSTAWRGTDGSAGLQICTKHSKVSLFRHVRDSRDL